MKEIIHKSALPIYLTAAVWVLYCIIFPLYKWWHFAIMLIVAVLAYELFSKLFPGSKEYVEIPPEPVTTGDEQLDALLKEGELALSEMRRLRGSIKNNVVCTKIERLIELTDKIFKDVVEDRNDYRAVRRFADYFLPTTIKLLNEYDLMGSSGVTGDNTVGTMKKIEDVLDTTILAYEKQLDALFADQALDIETDIAVMKAMMKKEGLTASEF